MAITQALCNSFKLEILNGVHRAEDEYRLALYTSLASLNEDTTRYTPDNEVIGAGYTAGGLTLADRQARLDGRVAVVDFANAIWPVATITARGALIYNASRDGRAVAVFDFGGDVSSTNGEFRVALPEPTADEALIRVG